MKRRTIHATLLTSVVLILAACNGGGEDTAPTATGGPTDATPASDRPFTDEEARAAAADLLRALEDEVPPDWTELPPEDEEQGPTPTFRPLEGECAELPLEEGTPEPGEIVEEISATFESPDEAIEIEFNVEIFDREANAERSFGNARRLAGECGDQFAPVFLELVRQELARETAAPGDTPIALEVTDFTIEELPFTGFGDDSGLLRLTTFFMVDGEEFPSYLDLVGVRVGNVIAGFSYQTNFDPPELAGEEEFAARVEEQVRQAADSLK